tara:strand:- start:248 stop:520 length:273 start_codon:yes stop_codon:yes gene_type:complete
MQKLKKIFFDIVIILTNVSFHEDDNEKSKNYQCQYCGKPGKMYTSPWKIPASVIVCKFHLFTLIFSPRLTDFALYPIFLIALVIIWLIFF